MNRRGFLKRIGLTIPAISIATEVNGGEGNSITLPNDAVSLLREIAKNLEDNASREYKRVLRDYTPFKKQVELPNMRLSFSCSAILDIIKRTGYKCNCYQVKLIRSYCRNIKWCSKNIDNLVMDGEKDLANESCTDFCSYCYHLAVCLNSIVDILTSDLDK